MILVPTDFERNTLLRIDPSLADAEMMTVGMGLMAAGITTAELLTQRGPSAVILVGIAGSFDQHRLRLGEAAFFNSVRIDGFGARDQLQEMSFGELGWSHDFQQPVHDEIKLSRPADSRLDELTLLSVPSASGDAEVASARISRHPNAVAEDMETFAVALACARLSAPLTVCRGVSNLVGDRDKANWRVTEALTAVAIRLNEWLGKQKS